MATDVHVPIVAAPQDAHGEAQPVAAANVGQWQDLPQVQKHGVGEGVRVGVVDTELGENPWFLGQVHGDNLNGQVTGLLAQNYKAGHATFIAGLVLQQAPGARVQVRGVLNRDGQGSIDDVVTAAIELAEGTPGEPVDILNLSLGCYGTAADKATFQALLNQLWAINPNLVVCCAAGNLPDNGQPAEFLPASLSDHTRLVSVGAATDETAQTLAPWCNTGPWLTFLADGSKLISTYLKFTTNAPNPPGRWVKWQGSSFATAVTSGLIAAAMSPGNGTHRLGPDAVQFLLNGRQRPASLPITRFVPGP